MRHARCTASLPELLKTTLVRFLYERRALRLRRSRICAQEGDAEPARHLPAASKNTAEASLIVDVMPP